MAEDTEKKEEIEVEEEEWFEPEGELVVDIWEDDEEIVVQAPVAGVDKDSLEIIVDNNVLKIKGVRENPNEEEKDYLITECYWGPFSKEIGLPQKIEREKVKASVENSILNVHLPKKEEEGKKVKIE